MQVSSSSYIASGGHAGIQASHSIHSSGLIYNCNPSTLSSVATSAPDPSMSIGP